MIFGRDLRSVYQSGSNAFVAPVIITNSGEEVATQNFFFAPTAGFSPSMTVNGNTITITFQLQQLKPDATILYLQAATVEKNTNANLVGFEAGEFRDKLTAPIAVKIDENTNQFVPDTNSIDPKLINSGADIHSCRIEIF